MTSLPVRHFNIYKKPYKNNMAKKNHLSKKNDPYPKKNNPFYVCSKYILGVQLNHFIYNIRLLNNMKDYS